jgi:murein DD-endopeptidase MepM/ murein hydrolase activator NlpD
MPNPYLFDGRLALLYWTPRSVPETTIEQLADHIRAGAPNVNAVLIKTSNGIGWQGAYDSTKPNLAINSVSDVQRWVAVLASRGLECHAWHVARGTVPSQEADRVADICNHSGIQSMLIDLELGQFYFVGDQNAAQALAVGIRQRVGPDFHVGLIFDARGNKPAQLWIQTIWFPETDSLHPMVYHYHFGLSPQQALQNCYSAIGGWGKPIYPMLQAYTPDGFPPYPATDVPLVASVAINAHHAAGMTFFRYGIGLRTSDGGMNRDELSELAKVNLPTATAVGTPPVPPEPVVLPPPPVPPPTTPALVIVDPENERTGEFAIHYYGDPDALSPGWGVDLDVNGRPYAYRPAKYNAQTLYVAYVPRLTAKGDYAIEAFIPGQHAYARDVHYVIVDYTGGVRREVTVILDQSPHYDQWVPLQGSILNGQPGGALVTHFELDPAFADAGRVHLADVTFIDPNTHPSRKFEIAFGAIRWRPVTEPALPPQVLSFDSPVGTEAERAGSFATGNKIGQSPVWVGQWYDANPYGSRYWLGNRWAIHTGADLNLAGGVLADKDAPVYAAAGGQVVWARFISPGWKNIIVIEHPVPGENRVIYARYAHVAHMRVQEGDLVRRGQPIATIGEYAPNNYHLHFDVSPDPILKRVPGHWPGDDLAGVQRYYADPLLFIKQYHVVR